MTTTRFLCLCPTWGRPRHIIENTLACFADQTWPHRYLIILDDMGTLPAMHGDRWSVFSSPLRYPSLPAKYSMMLMHASQRYPDWNAVVPWDDDDLYLADHLTAHAWALSHFHWSHPSSVWSTYPGYPDLESAKGRFYAAAAVRRNWFEHFGGWRDTKRADFDQLFLRDCAARSPGDPVHWGSPQFVFRWTDTGCPHAQHFIRRPDDVTWYDNVQPACTDPIADLEPRYDDSALKTMAQIDEILGQKTVHPPDKDTR